MTHNIHMPMYVCMYVWIYMIYIYISHIYIYISALKILFFKVILFSVNIGIGISSIPNIYNQSFKVSVSKQLIFQ